MQAGRHARAGGPSGTRRHRGVPSPSLRGLSGPRRGDLQVVANKKVPRKVEVILQEDVKQVGVRGAIANVAAGFYRNYLLPNGLAQPVTETVLSQIKAEEAKVDAKKKSVSLCIGHVQPFIDPCSHSPSTSMLICLLQLKGRAETIARALEVAKNFIIKKEAKDETIYGRSGTSLTLLLTLAWADISKCFFF